MRIVNKVMEIMMRSRLKAIEQSIKQPFITQLNVLLSNIETAKNTIYGKEFGFDEIKNIEQFQQRVPLVTYEDFEPYIELARKGEKDVTWQGKIRWFAKSSGTTNAKSKFIPISKESLEDCHYSAGKSMFALYLNAYPETEIFLHKNLRIGGSSELYRHYQTQFGDLSAILIENLPFYAELKNIPNKEISLMADWNLKMDAIIQATKNEDVGSLTGVPSWMLVVLNKMLTDTNSTYIDELWPNIEVFFHGGVSFKPYEENYRNITKKQLNFFEIYNASEGFFAIQDQLDKKELLLLLDNGIFYEFIEMENFGQENPKCLTIDQVEIGKNYALVISTNGGLWRYIIGDTVRFTSTSPHRIVITGRTKHHINVFGEELMIENAEEALKLACEKTNAIVAEYSAAPVYMVGKEKGAHEWVIEFSRDPTDLETFIDELDRGLQSVNSDYEAKRYNNMTLNRPLIHKARKGLFIDWMKRRGKLGGQNKIPRLSNTREYIEPLIALNQSQEK
ncbi:GH3 auxin-responsive promoter family protein [Weeksella virosa]|uniref:GH3 auxin-responsive promoter n=1 Tax=Weeksella virosa (strain ATCC 43766 / DSM 16922 / JCM 21250 / CCUG 30538 / CDC 9751 / IAM 14551 / NBRC 16016 / NCTC 11634 / CL345/78) TaxID=865938 RepID=F0P0U8_WEEVC|nr:GH3 auxin-responsive promoter family protein [Weeksella virosa]ADX67512.1 GH3 auxin-responsive promoter [Weeksella virosa DSM 16922]VEH64866.1 GH3 auxin-responsive promoter [Weeksella virosa]